MTYGTLLKIILGGMKSRLQTYGKVNTHLVFSSLLYLEFSATDADISRREGKLNKYESNHESKGACGHKKEKA